MSNKRILLLVLGVILVFLTAHDGWAAGKGGITYNDSRFAESVDAVMAYLEGSFGAMVMAAAGIATVLCAAFGQYRLALSLLVVAIGAFVLRSLVSTFFNDVSLDGGSAQVAVVRMNDEDLQSGEVPDAQVYEQEDGVEIYTAAGTNVRSFEDGTVLAVDSLSDRGTSVVIKHAGGRQTAYGHLAKSNVRIGQAVKSGDVIGTVGASGLAKDSKPRLYFEIRQNKKAVLMKDIYPTIAISEEGEIQDAKFLTKKILGPDVAGGAVVQAPVQMERF